MYLLRTRDRLVGRSADGDVVGVVVLVEGMPEPLPESGAAAAA
ncbi:hypothetical protein [Streptomyces broussonetiae]|uniref:GNAT family N-acetyltransferase n=1 Tax=Streptomyces broussonetiae TaxID=2686304 RepID=A0ABV5EHZ0_9ACTN